MGRTSNMSLGGWFHRHPSGWRKLGGGELSRIGKVVSRVLGVDKRGFAAVRRKKKTKRNNPQNLYK